MNEQEHETSSSEPIYLNEAEDPTNTKKESEVVLKVRRVEFDIYFDGTWNSKFNSNWYNNSDWYNNEKYMLNDKVHDHNPDSKVEQQVMAMYKADQTSFARAPTGVDQMHRAAITENPYKIPLYADGSGTTTPSDNPYLYDDVNDYKPSSPDVMQNDTLAGSSVGMGPTGVYAKMNRMFEHVQDRLNRLKDDVNEHIGIVIFNVYGFSRGATTARMFVYRIIKERMERAIKNKLDLSGYKVMVKFVGLFDTVSSIGPSDHNNDVLKDKLGTKFNKDDITGKIVHLVAGHEFRQKYSVTNIRDAVLGGYGFEVVLPGNHTDIGDGKSTNKKFNKKTGEWFFVGNTDRKVILQKDVSLVSADMLLAPAAIFSRTVRDQFHMKRNMQNCNLEVAMDILVKQGWFDTSKHEIWINKTEDKSFHMLEVKRILKKGYPRIPTWIMITLIKESDAYNLNDSLLVKYSIDAMNDSKLNEIYDDLLPQVLQKWQDTFKFCTNQAIYNNDYSNRCYVTVKNEGNRRIMFNKYLQWSSELIQDFKNTMVTVNLPRINPETNQFYREVING